MEAKDFAKLIQETQRVPVELRELLDYGWCWEAVSQTVVWTGIVPWMIWLDFIHKCPPDFHVETCGYSQRFDMVEEALAWIADVELILEAGNDTV